MLVRRNSGHGHLPLQLEVYYATLFVLGGVCLKFSLSSGQVVFL